MKRFIIAAVIVTLLVATSALAFTSPKASAVHIPSDPLAGVWTATDTVDGSSMLLFISPRLRVLLFDDGATGCGGDPLIPALVIGRGVSDPVELVITGRIICLPGGVQPITFALAKVGDTLVDPNGSVFTRIRIFP